MIRAENLTKHFGRTVAVDGVSFEVARGEIVGFLGPNGAGKTTTMRILATFLPATAGTAIVAGFDVFRDSLEVRRRIGYLPETVPLYSEMRVSEYLVYRGRLKGLRGKALRQRMEEALDVCGLTTARRSVIGTLSKGFRQRVGLADALIHDPDVLILDEPTLGLDPQQIRQIRTLIKQLGERHTILLSSHILSEVQMICNRVLIIKAGRIVAADTTENLLSLLKGVTRVTVETQAPQDAAAAALRALPGITAVAIRQERDWNIVTCECAQGVDPRLEIFQLMAAKKWPTRELRLERRNLEDVFMEITVASNGANASVNPDENREPFPTIEEHRT